MYCRNCGTELIKEDQKCQKCGYETSIVPSENNNDIDLGDPSYYLIGLFLPIIRLFIYFRWHNIKKNSSRQVLIGFLIYILYFPCLIALSFKKIILFTILLIFLCLILIKEYKNNNKIVNGIINRIENSGKKIPEEIKIKIENNKIDSIYFVLGALSILTGIYILTLPIIKYCISYFGYIVGGLLFGMTGFLIPVGMEMVDQARQLKIEFNTINIYGFIILTIVGISLFLINILRKK